MTILNDKAENEREAIKLPINFKLQTFDEAQQVAKQILKILALPEQVYVGLNELLINAIEHGNLEIDFNKKTQLINAGSLTKEITRRLQQPQYKNRFVFVKITEDKTHFIITITDQGSGFDWLERTDSFMQTDLSKHGRGIIIAQLISFEKIQYLGQGNSVRCYVPKSNR